MTRNGLLMILHVKLGDSVYHKVRAPSHKALVQNVDVRAYDDFHILVDNAIHQPVYHGMGRIIPEGLEWK